MSNKALAAAFRLLGRRDYSQRQLELRLERKGFSPEVIAATIMRLVELNLLNDRRYSIKWVEHRARFKPCGLQLLRYELHSKGLSSEDIEHALLFFETHYASEELCFQAAEKYCRGRDIDDKEKLRRKLFAFLRGRGFNYEDIKHCCQKLILEDGL